MITVLVASIYKRLHLINLSNYPQVNNVRYIVNIQCKNESERKNVIYLTRDINLQRNDIIFESDISSGLSKNRNILLNLIGDDDDIIIIADDDVSYCPEFFENITSAYEADKKADFITFKICTPEDEYREYKKYKNYSYIHDKFSIMHISSIEITFRAKAFKNAELSFDERFGLGSNLFNKHEEAIFLSDAIDFGLCGKFVSEYSVIHPFESSGKLGYEDIDTFRDKIGMLYRIWGCKSYFFVFYILIKNFKKLHKLGLNKLCSSISYMSKNLS
ncbi:TPA: hypothetical protein ACX6RC_003526 [Photobacterium damselae]